ncbi:MAG: hypothetical protein GY822_18920 [Deltaproteobacteria bacterium]|nr:hypothetical protein [Deltaproteobacteria bacterium]
MNALAVSEPDPLQLGHILFEELKKNSKCLHIESLRRHLKMTCLKKSITLPWPPKDGRELAQDVDKALGFLAKQKRPISMSLAHRIARQLALSMDDPYTAYLPPVAVKRLDTHRMAEVTSPGLELSPYKPTLIRAVRPGSNADELGIRGGDHILEIDGISSSKMTLAELSSFLIGTIGSKVDLLIRREGKGKRHFFVERTLIPEEALKQVMLADEVLYLRLSAFSPGVAGQVKKVLWKRQPKKLVLDLRHNSGGLIAEGAALLDLFFNEGPLGGVRPRAGRPVTDFSATHNAQDFLHLPLVVLVDGGTASASELVSLSLKQRKRALIVGSRSLGKGSAQSLVRIPGGGLLRVTEAYYIGPLGKKLARAGITPDSFFPAAKGRTVLEGGDATRDAWVLMAVDLLRFGDGKTGSVSRRKPLYHQAFDDK